MANVTASAGLRAEPAPAPRPDGAGHQSVGPKVSSFRLENGLTVVVIPDHRVPVVTHMVWYRNGSADDPLGHSGIAHFLEHLMFKGTEQHPAGEFTQLVSALGGEENAFTSFDYTAYYQRVAREHLETMMSFEADRMTGLVLDDAVVAPERDVVLEERRMRVETDPAAQLMEAMDASLFVHHPYGIPIIGWMHEIEGLNRQHALDYYRRFYTPENAILVVAGDVTEQDVRELAERTYGLIPARGEPPVRIRPKEPEPKASRTIRVADPRVEQELLRRLYLVPSSRTAQGKDTFALELLAEILGGGPTSYLYRRLVLERGVAVDARSGYFSSAVDDSRVAFTLVPADGVSLENLEQELDEAIAAIEQQAFAGGALARAKTQLLAQRIYSSDNHRWLAQVYGSSLAIGESLEEVEAWPNEIDAVTEADLIASATRFLTPQRAVTGLLVRRQDKTEGTTH